jgi:adenosylmethionine-8-amino-7-oxononanoate aminotransferase
MATWGPAAGIHGAPLLRRGEGVFLFDDNGKDYLDWTSQAVCSNLGHTMPESVKEALTAQMNTLPFVYSGFGIYENRVRLSSLIAELLPGDLNGFLFPTSGAEANEAAIRMARRFTGKTKIINQYRSYHGGTTSTVTATGDFRRNFAEGTGGDGAVGFVKTMNATDNHLFSFGATDEERTAKALGFLEEQIICEGPHTIAAVMFESINGSAGVYQHPLGYMEGVRALCTKYDILMICDEVMVGFGRTGKMWGFQHYDIQPDILTSAKGLTGAWMPCSMVAVSSKIKSFFEVNPLGWGSTFHAHPMNLAVAYASVKHMLDMDLVGHVKNNVEPVMLREVSKITEKYDCVGQGRVLGGFACVDLLDPRSGLPIQEFSGKNCSHPEAILTFRKELLNNGLIGFVRPPQFHCAPPHVITPDELEEGFARANRALDAYAACF